ncbi:MAG: CAP domain-containing protein [Spirochaetales bacterium]|nr:CAP domain-containing protein [Spirochaetales bacterium]
MKNKNLIALIFLIPLATMVTPLFCQPFETTLWFNQYRESFGLNSLTLDALLENTAQAYAREIAQSNRFSHKDLQKQRAQSRYFNKGGTHALVGEILGIGPDADKIEKQWKASEKHIAVIKDPRWTHFGQGFFFINRKLIYVLLFTKQWVAEINYGWNDKGDTWFLKGRWLLTNKPPILYNGIKVHSPSSWDQTSMMFSYKIKTDDLAAYLRLGYQDQGFQVTNIFYPYKLR